MAYDYQIQVGGTSLSTLVDNARFIKWTAGAKRGSNPVIPYRHGELGVTNKFYGSTDILLEVVVSSATNAEAAESLSEIHKLLSVQGLVVVQQVDPHRGSIRASVELVTEPVATQNRFTYLFGLHNPKGMWEDVSASSAGPANPPSVTTSGDLPVDDMTLTFAGPGFLEHTDSLGNLSRVTIDAAAGAGTYVVDVGAGTVTKTGVDQDEFLTVTQPWWMVFSPGEAQSFTSDVNVTVSWRNKWA